MMCIHYKEVIKKSDFNLLHDIINPPKRANHLNSHYSPIIHGYMNTIKRRAKLKSFESYWTMDLVPLF